MKANPTCNVCGTELNDSNWYPSSQKYSNYICKKCCVEKTKQWWKANPEKAKAAWTRRNRKRGELPMSKNKTCASYLGVHIAERVLSHIFKDVVRMPYGNPGFDVICNRKKLIDIKSSCLHKDGRWYFQIRHNTTADYFLCLALDNREDLNPLYAWLLPGSKFDHLKGTSIRPSTIHKWDAYRLDVTKVITCCNTMRTPHKTSMKNTE